MRKIAALIFLLLLAPTLAFATEQSSSTQKPTTATQKSTAHKQIRKKNHTKATKKNHKPTKHKVSKPSPSNQAPKESAPPTNKKLIPKKKDLANNQVSNKNITTTTTAASIKPSNVNNKKLASPNSNQESIKTTSKSSANQTKKVNTKQAQASNKTHKLAHNKTHKQSAAAKTHLASSAHNKPVTNRDDDEEDDGPGIRTTRLNNNNNDDDTYTEVNKRLQSDTDSASPRFSSSSTSTIPSSKIHNLMEYATSFVGSRYHFGGDSPRTGFDCSGYVKYVFQHQFGISLPHNAAAMSRIGKRVAQTELRPGDLVLFTTLRRSFGHVGIYIGNNHFIHAASSRTGVVEISSLDESYWARAFRGGRRLALGSDYSDY